MEPNVDEKEGRASRERRADLAFIMAFPLVSIPLGWDFWLVAALRGASDAACWLGFGLGAVGALLAAGAITSRLRRDAGPWGPRAFMLGCVLACLALLAWGTGMLGAYLGI